MFNTTNERVVDINNWRVMNTFALFSASKQQDLAFKLARSLSSKTKMAASKRKVE